MLNLIDSPSMPESCCALANLELSSPTFLAPMQGVGAAGIRDVLAHLGPPGVMCAPFVRITGQRPNISSILARLHKTANVPLSAQLLGNHAEHLALAAKVMADAGVEVVDLNLGCPTRQAAKKGVGAALLSEIDTISTIVTAMRAECSCPLSVKIRIVDDTFDEVIRIAKAIENAGADFLVVHPRTGDQGYRGVVDWNVVKRLKQNLRVPVVGNGDLWYAADALRLMRSSGADAVMIGRPALRNPFLFGQIDALRAGRAPYVPTGNDIVDHVERLAAHAELELRPRQHGPAGAIKEQIQYLLRAVPEPFRTVLWQQARQAVGLRAVLRAIEPLRDIAQLDLAADGPLRLEATPVDPN